MKALVLTQAGHIAIEDREFDEVLGDNDVKIKIHSVGICGSDVHYYKHGRIGPFVVEAPMVLGHEAAGIVLESGKNVTHLKAGDRVCMEPGIPDMHSDQSRAGLYNLDPAVRFWATPPVHGCLRETVIHPAAFTFKLPENVSFREGAMVEPLAVAMQAATKAGIKPGDIGLVLGAGPIAWSRRWRRWPAAVPVSSSATCLMKSLPWRQRMKGCTPLTSKPAIWPVKSQN